MMNCIYSERVNLFEPNIFIQFLKRAIENIQVGK